ncbi:MAG: DUF1592 domain-containing protein [Myxococcota bacterium]
MALLCCLAAGCYDGHRADGDDGEPGATDGSEDGAAQSGEDGSADSGGSDDDGGDGWTADCEPEVGVGGIRMLNRREYQNTLEDLVGLSHAEIEAITVNVPSDATVGFDNNAASLAPSAVLIEEQLSVAEDIAAAADLASLLSCDPASPEDPAQCRDTFVDGFARLAFRRPVQAEERALFESVYAAAEVDGLAFDDRMRLVIQAILQSPQFLYRIERSASDGGGVEVVGAYELASRLSYFLWASMPDVELLDAADQEALGTASEVEAQVRRMLEDPKARTMTAEFHRQWLEVATLDDGTKDVELVPNFDALKPSLAAEAIAFTQHVLWDGAGTADALLTSDTIFVDDLLAELYWIDGQFGAELQPIAATDKRFGLLTLGSILAQTSISNRTSPTRRGKFVRAQLLCTEPPPPPDDVEMLDPVPAGEATTTRERLDQHLTDPSCAACHSFIDPIGFGMENYDLVGEFRLSENASLIDASGELEGLDVADESFDGVRELSERLVEAPQFEACVAQQWFRFAMGRAATPQDVCQLEELQLRMNESGGDLTELIVDVATSHAMRHIATESNQ